MATLQVPTALHLLLVKQIFGLGPHLFPDKAKLQEPVQHEVIPGLGPASHRSKELSTTPFPHMFEAESVPVTLTGVKDGDPDMEPVLVMVLEMVMVEVTVLVTVTVPVSVCERVLERDLVVEVEREIETVPECVTVPVPENELETELENEEETELERDLETEFVIEVETELDKEFDTEVDTEPVTDMVIDIVGLSVWDKEMDTVAAADCPKATEREQRTRKRTATIFIFVVS